MKAFQQNLAKLEASDTQVLGVSVDSSFANGAWAKQIGVTFPILSDLGVYNPKYKAARRVTYLIDKEGKVVHMNVDKEALDPTNVVAACERRKLKN
jgi:peroxiredoxin